MLQEMSTLSFALCTAARRFVRLLPAPAGFARRRVGLLVGHSLVLGTVIASTPAAAQPPAGDVIPEHELRTHHIGFQMGLLNPSTEIVGLGNPGLDVEGNRFLAVLNYRYSLNSFVDLTGDLRSWGGPWTTPASQHVKLGVYLVGPGMRLYGLNRTTDRRVMPYLQGNIYHVEEELVTSERLAGHGIGFGLSGGVDLNMSRLISIPIEATYIGTSGDDIDDLSGFGFSLGVNFSF